MDVKEAIRTRRSIRDYKEKEVKHGLIADVLEHAKFAPSAGNLQNWRVVVVTDKEKRKKLSESAIDQDWMLKAPVHLVVCNLPDDVKSLYGRRGERLYSIQDCAAFSQNILLIAHSLGLGACWVGAFDEGVVRRTLNIPDSVIPEAIITLGYQASKPKETGRLSLAMTTFFEKWGVTSKEFGLTRLVKRFGKGR